MSKMSSFSVVVAATVSTWGIGKNGTIPWKLPTDMKFFKEITTHNKDSTKKNAVIMGRKTYQSIPLKFRPMSQRINVIISKNANLRQELALPEDVILVTSLQEALTTLSSRETELNLGDVFVIGGESIYRESITLPECKKIYLTTVESPEFTDLDTFFPIVPATKFQLTYRSQVITENGINFRFTELNQLPEHALVGSYREKSFSMVPSSLYPATSVPNYEEQQYLDILRDILANGVRRGDRTGTGTISKFGVQMRFSLRDNKFPLLTTKRVFWRGVAEELLWFVQGCTNANTLAAKDIHIWDGNGSREFLDKCGFNDREVGDLGPVYGFQWRHFGAAYENMHSDYNGKGIDQLKECIDRIKNTPEDRRILLTAWNPADLKKMVLPACHVFAQFYVANNELSCQMYQRSADMGLGVPFNIASYSLLTTMMAQVCGLKPGDFVHTIGDAHIYLNHIDALQEQVKRVPKPFPKLLINPAVNDIDGFQYSDFTIEGYTPDAAIKMTMAV